MSEHHCAIIDGEIMEYTAAEASRVWAGLKREVKARIYRCPFCKKRYPAGRTKESSYAAWEEFSKDVIDHFACQCGFTTGNTLSLGTHLYERCVLCPIQREEGKKRG